LEFLITTCANNIKVMKIVRAIREGRILPYKPPEEREKEEPKFYDIWASESQTSTAGNLPAPKLAPPTHDESYNPPEEFLPSKKERETWLEADDEDREKHYLPTKYTALRKVPGYDKIVKERFERCLDLYLAPRVRRSKLNIDPNDLLPKLPNPEDLRPFPSAWATVYRGHVGKVRTVSIHPSGVWVSTGGDDGTVRIWELLSGRQLWSVKLSDEAVNAVRWRPGAGVSVLAAAAGESVYFIVPPVLDPESEEAGRTLIDSGFGYAASNPSTNPADKQPPTRWARPGEKLEDQGVLLQVTCSSPAKTLVWHRRGDYLATSSPTALSSSVIIHTLSKHISQLPFRRLKGIAQDVHFHPSKPILFVATQRTIRCYDLQEQRLLRILQPGARWISGFDIHPGGDNVVVGSFDRRLLWHDLELSTRPYKTLRYHERAIRNVRYHQRMPLFASASDDGTIQVFHGKVVSDLLENATIVPLKVLKGHDVVGGLGVLELDWCRNEAWVVSCGADGTARLWM
jgi:ribosome biogenesis protein ERB1